MKTLEKVARAKSEIELKKVFERNEKLEEKKLIAMEGIKLSHDAKSQQSKSAKAPVKLSKRAQKKLDKAL